ncbi:MAG: Flp pilus assembly complex ATPase component TadA [Elusimicrobia bacterium]|nr:Flp pilus assembly complex ATPase component TadA [Elusimicrobiota bacterium]
MALDIFRKKYIGEVLLSKNYITKEQLQEAVTESVGKKQKLGEYLVSKGYVSEENFLECLGISLGIEYVKLEDLNLKENVFLNFDEKSARKYNAFPISISEDNMVLAMDDPTNVVYRDEIAKITGKKISVVLAAKADILSAIERYYVRSSLGEDGEDEIKVDDETTTNIDENDISDADAAPVVKYVNSIFFDAVTKKASDIHLEPFEKGVSLRMRIDGELRNMHAPAKKYYPAIVSRIKIMSFLDIAERRLPQDGKCRINVLNQRIDVRVSIIPTIWGEKIVLRILAKSLFGLDINRVGFSKQELAFFKESITAPYGMILVTGPTSSGKTTTLYSALSDINQPDINIVTVEDPVEYEMKGINQVNVRPNIGLDFARVLRTFMRQDPDVILVGEIRDSETAKIAIQAALTGHLVFSTLHTNDTVSTISRMVFMGVEEYLLADALNLIIAQRLVRVICPHCKKEVENVPDDVYKKLGIDRSVKVYEGEGCRNCDGMGYKGRTAIFEMLNVTSELKDAISRGAGYAELRKIANDQGLVSLRQAALAKLKEGVTTIEEVLATTVTEK